MTAGISVGLGYQHRYARAYHQSRYQARPNRTPGLARWSTSFLSYA